MSRLPFPEALIALAVAAPAAAEEMRRYECADAVGETFSMILFSPAEGGEPLHCIRHPRLDAFTPCAPQGGWGLSEEWGALRSFATGPAPEHEGYWFFARVGPSELVASASLGTRPPLALEIAGETFWRMRLTLETGEGIVEPPEGEIAVSCEAP